MRDGWLSTKTHGSSGLSTKTYGRWVVIHQNTWEMGGYPSKHMGDYPLKQVGWETGSSQVGKGEFEHLPSTVCNVFGVALIPWNNQQNRSQLNQHVLFASADVAIQWL